MVSNHSPHGAIPHRSQALLLPCVPGMANLLPRLVSRLVSPLLVSPRLVPPRLLSPRLVSPLLVSPGPVSPGAFTATAPARRPLRTGSLHQPQQGRLRYGDSISLRRPRTASRFIDPLRAVVGAASTSSPRVPHATRTTASLPVPNLPQLDAASLLQLDAPSRLRLDLHPSIIARRVERARRAKDMAARSPGCQPPRLQGRRP